MSGLNGEHVLVTLLSLYGDWTMTGVNETENKDYDYLHYFQCEEMPDFLYILFSTLASSNAKHQEKGKQPPMYKRSYPRLFTTYNWFSQSHNALEIRYC